MEDSPKTSYKQILKSTFIMGGSSVINTLLGIVRTKIIALILGPIGVGLTGIYMSITGLVSTISGVGIRESGIRQIANACGTNDQTIIARTVITLRRASLVSGAVGLLMLFLLSSSVSKLTFGNYSHAYDVALLSTTILFGAVSGGQTALIQGMRRIGDLAKISMLGALFGTILSIPILYLFRELGIVYNLIIVSATGILTSWWYSRKIELTETTVSWRDSIMEAKPLLKFGGALMLGLLIIFGTQYLLRVLVVRYSGLNAAGIYHASTTLSSIYVSMILNAMMTDFYPRLSAASHDHDLCRSLINEQIEVGLLLAVPGILAVMTLAPLVIAVFYSSKFMPAVEILRWQILGVLLQVVSWPMGFMLRAKGSGKLFFWTELFANCTLLGLALIGIKYFALPGVGMAFFGMNLCYLGLIHGIVRTNYGFYFSRSNMKVLGLFSLATGVVFLSPYVLSGYLKMILNAGITVVAGIYAIRTLSVKTNADIVPGFFLKIRAPFSF